MHHDHNTSNEDTREDVAENDSKTEFRYDISRRNLLRRSLKGGINEWVRKGLETEPTT